MKSETGAGESAGIGNDNQDRMASAGRGETAFKIGRTIDWSGAVPEGVVCPACGGELHAGAKTLVCTGCGRKYPVVDGIPVLIVERAEQP